MPTVVADPMPIELEQLLERRRRLGQDLLDEIWEGVHHMNPAPHARHARIGQQLAVLLDTAAKAAGLVALVSIFNLGGPDDYRVPDGGLFRAAPDAVYVETAALVIEIVSPGDETWHKLGFYAAHHVDELLIVDPDARQVHWLGLDARSECRPIDRSGLIHLDAATLADQLDWPA